MHVLVVYGDDKSPECDISRVTGAAMVNAARNLGHQVSEMDLDDASSPLTFSNILDLDGQLKIDMVLNGLHGGAGEDGRFAAGMEGIGLSYTHSGFAASSWGMNKSKFKQKVFRAVADDVVDFERLAIPLSYTVEHVYSMLGADSTAAFVVKPNGSGSSVGLHLLKSVEDLNALDNLPQDALFEKFIEGTEVTCGVVGTGVNARVLPPTAIIKPDPNALLDYKAKYIESPNQYVTPATGIVPDEVLREVQRIAYFLHTHFKFRSMTRSDFIVTSNGSIHLLEINSNPGCTPTSFVPQQAECVGLSFDQLISFVIEDARIYWENRR